MSLRLSGVCGLLLATLGAGALLLAAGCGQSKLSSPSGGGMGAPAALTPIADCIVNGENDVIIGGPDAKKGCDNVEMEPSSANPGTFDEIMVADGGTLTITGDDEEEGSSTASVASRASIPPAPLEVRDICIEDGGTVEYGTKAKPITNKTKVVLEFIGNRGAPFDNTCPNFSKGIEVMEGGTLRMYGAKGVPARGGVSWTTLAAPAGSQVAGVKVKSLGTKTLKLTDDVTKGTEGWAAGDWIVVATTGYNPFETEFVQIANVTSGGKSGGSTVTLKQPLKYYHFGSLPPSSATESCADPLHATLPSAPATQPAFLCDGADRNYGVDERAEVGLISRDIELTAQTEPVTTVPPPATSSVHWGGEIMIHPGFKEVAIQGVRLSKFGKDQLGSYPIHFHMLGDAANKPLIDADSIDHSYNHCVTIHSTANLKISNLVCARIVGSIFYEELMGAKENNPADDSGLVFDHDLGIGAMSYSFDIYGNAKLTRQQLIDQYWWAGDYMTNDSKSPAYINYDAFNVPDTDNWLQAAHGSCTQYNIGHTGGFQGYLQPNPDPTAKAACPPADPNLAANTVYIETPAGFWIQNPGTVLTNNAIAGCQGAGIGYWWAPPNVPIMANNRQVQLKYQLLGNFRDNRVSGCYNGFYGETQYSMNSTEQLMPHAGGEQDASSLITSFDGMTATHNRFRGVWLRPTWFVIKNGHFAANRENVSLVSSGGIDGNAPGVWELLEDSVLAGESQNNVERWGPCPQENVWGVSYTGSQFGCIASTPPPAGVKPHSGEELGEGYPNVVRNFFGYMLYDGPVRVFHDRFVNFNYNQGWTTAMPCTDKGAGAFYQELDTADCAFLKQQEASRISPTVPPPPGTIGSPPTPYEGDAALGWFQSNQSEYPTGTVSRELMWVNTNLRHQIYTEFVNIADFNDGDKNTAIIDEDGTLSGLGVKMPGAATGAAPIHAISLNNLPFNTTSNAVDEYLSCGAQNKKNENRETSLMSPTAMGALEFSNLYPFMTNPALGDGVWPGLFNTHFQYVTFTRDDTLPDGKGGRFHPAITLKSRDGQGIWEPKVSNGYGYTVTFKPIPLGTPTVPDPRNPVKAGAWKWIDVGVADVIDPNISKTHPFYIRLGINYTGTDGSHPANKFTVQRGYKSYTGGGVWGGDPALTDYWTQLDCVGLDSINNPHPANLPKPAGDGACPAASNDNAVATLKKANSYAGLTNADGTPNLGVYYYNQTTGYLYLNIAQDEPNPVAPSPVGSCKADGTGDASCPDVPHGETYYACPKNGCIIYTIAMNDSSYNPDPSAGNPDYKMNAKAPPKNPNQLVTYGTDTVITRTTHLDRQGTPYYTATNALACTATQPPAQ